MAIDKLVDSSQLDANLTLIANAIRTKNGTSVNLSFPNDFITAINAISGGGGGLETVTIFSSQTVTATDTDTSGYVIYLDSITENLVADTNYIVTMDGTLYLCYAHTVYDSIYAGDFEVVWGTPANAIYPFAIGSYANNRTQWMVADNSPHTVKIERVVSMSGSGNVTYETIVPTTTVSATAGDWMRLTSGNTPTLIDGKYYSYFINGVEYVATAITGNNTIYLSNILWDWDTANGYAIGFDTTYGGIWFNSKTAGTYTVKVDKITFSDGGSEGDSSSETWEVVFNDSITVSNNEIQISELANLYFAEDETWKVTIDDVEYICETIYYSQSDLYFIGNIKLASGTDDGTGEPFCLYNLGWANALTGDFRTNGTHTIKLEKQIEGSVTPSSDNPLNGKIATFTGDSICAGQGYAGGYASIIGTENNMTIQNLGVGDGCVAPYSDQYGNRFVINTSIADMRSDADFVILEGGGNDAGYGITLGSLTSGYTDTLDTTTFAGAFENMLKSAIAKFPSAKIGYIFIHKCEPNFDSRTTNSYYNIAKSACEKWGIPYCDLNTCVPPLGYINNLISTYTTGDGIHPNELGYRTFYVPQITAFMKTMLTDYTSISKTVTTNGTYLASDDNVSGYSSITVNVPTSVSVTWETKSDQGITITSDGTYNYATWTYTEPLQADETYRITWGENGTQYICETVLATTSGTYDGYYLGNASIVNVSEENTGEPFILYRNSSTRMVVTTTQATGSWRIKVEKQVSTPSTPSATQHTIVFEFSDETSTTLTGYWDAAFITSTITATTPTEYGGKTVSSALLDGVAWYTYAPSSETWNTVFESNSLQYNQSQEGVQYPYCWISDLTDLYPAADSVWRITFNGTTYRCIAKTIDGRVIIGNSKFVGGTDDGSGVPFAFVNQGFGAWAGEADLPNQETFVPVKIEQLVSA